MDCEFFRSAQRLLLAAALCLSCSCITFKPPQTDEEKEADKAAAAEPKKPDPQFKENADAAVSAAEGHSLVEKDPDRVAFVDAKKLLDAVIDGMTRNDYAAFSSGFGDGLKMVLTSEKFAEENVKKKNSFGDFASSEYLGMVRKTNKQIFLWKARYSKTSEDVLIRLVVQAAEGKKEVIGFWIE